MKRTKQRNSVPKTGRQVEERKQALATLALMRRRHWPLRKAAKADGTSPNTVRRYVGSALRLGRDGDYWAKPYDHIERTLNFITDRGLIPVSVNDSRLATEISEHSNAVGKYSQTGSAWALRRFKGRTVKTSKGILPFVTDTKVLDNLLDAGELEFDQLYRAMMGITS